MDDAAAIEKIQQGESDAFRFLVESYQKQAVAHAVAILGDREDAKDAAQEAFIDAFRSIKTFDKTRRFYSWFYVLLRNRCYKIAAKRRETQNLEEIEIIAPQEGLAREDKIALDRALMALPADDREIIALKYLDGLSYAEIAERLEIPRGTVMSRLFYARKALQTNLEKKYE